MLFDFRDSKYRMYKRSINQMPPKEFEGYVFAADTESVIVGDRWDTQLLTYYDSGQDARQDAPSGQGTSPEGTSPEGYGGYWWVGKDDNPLEQLLLIIGKRFQSVMSDSEKPKQWTSIYGYFHNLEYDWGQLIKNHDILFKLSKFLRVVKPVDVLVGENVVKLRRGLFKGSVCYITMEVMGPYGNYKLELRDTFAFFPTSLRNIAKQFGFPEKMERQEDIGKKDYREVPDSDKRKREFLDYAIRDAKITYMAAMSIMDMHEKFQIGLPKVSASSYACAVMTRHLSPDRPLLNIVGPNNLTQYALKCYYGGRFGGIRVGPVSGLNVFDINSSYPTALSCLPSFTQDTAVLARMESYEPITLKHAIKYARMFPCMFIEISGREIDNQYPALITRLKNGDLTPVYGKFEHIFTTGPEFLAGVMTGSLVDITVHSIVAWYDNNPFFKDLITTLFEIKRNSPKDSIMYKIAKLVMNSIYGKFIESHNFLRLLWLEDLMVLVKPGEEPQFGTKYYELFVEALNKEVDPFRYIANWMEHNDDMKVNRKKYENMMMSKLPLSIQDFGYYAIPPLAAAVTGIARARLYLAQKASDALYWDTDSVFTYCSKELLQEKLRIIPDDWYPAGVPRLRIGKELGDLDCEKENISGYLAGIKRYFFDENKSAHHGMAAIPKEMIGTAIKTIVETGAFSYDPGERPLNLLQAGRPEDVGKFIKLNTFHIKLNLDYRMNWSIADDGIFVGTMKDYACIIEEGKSTRKKCWRPDAIYGVDCRECGFSNSCQLVQGG